MSEFSKEFAMVCLMILFLIGLVVELVRLQVRPGAIKIFDKFFRKHEVDHASGSLYVLISSVICFAVFDYWIAVVAMLMMIFGDLFSAIIGKSVGGPKIYKDKTWIGTISGLIANFLVGIIILPFPLIVVPMAVVATITELFSDKLDDNLTVPMFAGFVGQMILYYLTYIGYVTF